MGIRSKVSRSTLAEANEARDWQIYADFAHHLIGIARKLYQKEPPAVELKNTVCALDAKTIDLCLSIFPMRTSSPGNKGSRLLCLNGISPKMVCTSTQVQLLSQNCG